MSERLNSNHFVNDPQQVGMNPIAMRETEASTKATPLSRPLARSLAPPHPLPPPPKLLQWIQTSKMNRAILANRSTSCRTIRFPILRTWPIGFQPLAWLQPRPQLLDSLILANFSNQFRMERRNRSFHAHHHHRRFWFGFFFFQSRHKFWNFS